MKFRNVIELDLGTVLLAAMTDGGAAVGTYDFATKKPAGFLPIAAKIENLVTFAGATTLMGELGTAADPDAYVDSGSVETLGDINALPGAAPALGLGADQTVRLTLTEDSEWGDLTAGKVSVKMYCIDMNDPVIKDS